jgi:hypothetical protein
MPDFSYPSDLLNMAFDDVSKVLCFVATITFFMGDWVDLGGKRADQIRTSANA